MLSFLNEILTHLCFTDTIYVEKSVLRKRLLFFVL